MNWREFQALQKVVEIDGRFMSYVDEGSGSGDPLVFIHGIPTWGYLWHGFIDTFSPVCRVLIPDLLGYGWSDRSDRFDRSIVRQADALDAWLEELGVERAIVIGHDIGGGIAMRLAALFPHRVSRLCVMNTICYDSWPIEMMLQLGHPEAYRKLSAAAVMTMLKTALRSGFASSPDDDLMAGLLAPWSTEAGKLSLIRNAASLNTNHTTEITPRLGSLDVPTMILWGEEDRFQPVKYGERLAADIPGATLVRVPGARHFVMLDRPDEVQRHVADFI